MAKKNGHHQESSVFSSKRQSLSFWTLRCWEGDSVWKASGEKGFPVRPPKIARRAYWQSWHMRLCRKSGQTGTDSERKFPTAFENAEVLIAIVCQSCQSIWQPPSIVFFNKGTQSSLTVRRPACRKLITGLQSKTAAAGKNKTTKTTDW